RHRLALGLACRVLAPVAHLAERLRDLVRRVVQQRGGDDVAADAEVRLGELREPAGGGIAALKVWTNGCRSVEERSTFSYQVAAGRTTSEKSAFEVIRKSIVVSRSSFPSGASSRQTTSEGRSSGGDSSARTAGSVVPSRCLRKYSWPFADEPSRFDRHTVRTRGQFSGASGSSQAKRRRPSRSSAAT